MSDIDVSKIPADVMATAKIIAEARFSEKYDPHSHRFLSNDIALAILSERAACAQHAFAMRWAPSPGLSGTKNAAMISQITTNWSQKIGMGILNR